MREWKKKILLACETTRKAKAVNSTSSKSLEIKTLCTRHVVTLFLRKGRVQFLGSRLVLKKNFKDCTLGRERDPDLSLSLITI